MLRGLLVIGPVLAVGLVAALVTSFAHEGDATFAFAQQNLQGIAPLQLESLVELTREPLSSGPGSRAISARCVHGGSGPKLNPWQCTVRYASGDAITYRIIVRLSGRFQGADRTGSRLISGCCLRGSANSNAALGDRGLSGRSAPA